MLDTKQIQPTFEKAGAACRSPLSLLALAYNIAQTAAWCHCGFLLYLAVGHDVFNGELLASATWPAVGSSVVLAQSLALVEPLLCLLGVIKSKIGTVIMQLLVRNIVLLLAVNRHFELQHHLSVFLFMLAWILSEIVRFPWLTLKVLGSPPPLLSLLRYTLPLILYPLGGIGEAWTMWRARSVLPSTDVLFHVGGNDLSLTHVVHYVYMPAYIPGFVFLYWTALLRFKKEYRNFKKKIE